MNQLALIPRRHIKNQRSIQDTGKKYPLVLNPLNNQSRVRNFHLFHLGNTDVSSPENYE